MSLKDPSKLLAGLTSTAVADAQKHGVLPSYVRRLHGSGPVAGRAVTCRCAPNVSAPLFEALRGTVAGDALVIQGSGDLGYFGELLGAEASRRGLALIVVDGLVRDLERLSELDLQIFAKGTTPASFAGGPPGDAENTGAGLPLQIGGATVEQGSWLVGDADGLVTIPEADIETVAGEAAKIEAYESDIWSRVRAGMDLADSPGKYGKASRG